MEDCNGESSSQTDTISPVRRDDTCTGSSSGHSPLNTTHEDGGHDLGGNEGHPPPPQPQPQPQPQQSLSEETKQLDSPCCQTLVGGNGDMNSQAMPTNDGNEVPNDNRNTSKADNETNEFHGADGSDPQQESAAETAEIESPKVLGTTAGSIAVIPTSILRNRANKSEGNTTATSHANNHNNAVTKVKCILFDLQPTFHDIPPRSDLTAEEIDDSWFCRLELEAMAAAALDPFNERNTNHAGGSRGLERYTAAGSSRLEIHRVQVVAAVLREQERQKSRAGNDNNNNNTCNSGAEKIAKAAQQLSHECQELAYRQGYNDEVEAHAGTDAIQTDVVVLNTPTLFKQMQALSDMMFLESQKKARQTSKR